MTPTISAWAEVSRENPCRSCGHDNWCRFSRDGAHVCRRVEFDGSIERFDKNGVSFWMGFPDGVGGRIAPVPFEPEPTPAPADPDKLHRAYTEMLSHLSISEEHRAQLEGRGFTREQITMLGVKSLGQASRSVARRLADLFPWWQQVPGLVLKDGKPTVCGWSGLLIPCPDLQGRITGLRIRADSPEAPKYSWLSSAKYGGPGPGSALSYWPVQTADTVRITEGELKSAFATFHTDVSTICAPGVSLFASSQMIDWLLELQVQTVILAPDADYRTNRHVYQAIRNAISRLKAASFRVVVEVWDSSAKGIDDALRAGLTVSTVTAEEFTQMTAPPAPPAQEASTPGTDQGWEIPWPNPIAKEAFHGVIGEIVSTIEPHTEADPAAIMLQAIAMAGHLIGTGPHYKVEGTRHSTNEYVVLVGTTGKGRKGTSWGRVREVGEAAVGFGPEGLQTINGLGSGEALISMMADKAEDQDLPSVEVSNRKRLLMMEQEYAHVLKVASREGNTCSPTLRAAWDGEPISNLTKGEKNRSTGHHLSMVGHITAQELRDLLSSVEVANGTANRNLVGVVRRSRYLPEGGALTGEEVQQLGARLRQCLESVKRMGKVSVIRDPQARALWGELYRSLSDGLPGLAGSILARGEAHVTRLSLIYALLDSSSVVRVEHLLAALAVWDYCVGSVLYLFGDKIGDTLADKILPELRDSPNGLTRTDINRLFQGNKSSSEITRSLNILAEQGLATKTLERGTDPNQKRPTEKWVAANAINSVNSVGSKAVPSYLSTAKTILAGMPTSLRTTDLTKLSDVCQATEVLAAGELF